jgi:hypothetical protein
MERYKQGLLGKTHNPQTYVYYAVSQTYKSTSLLLLTCNLHGVNLNLNSIIQCGPLIEVQDSCTEGHKTEF